MVQKKRILVVDDEKDLVDLLSARLDAAGYEVITAFDGAEGLEKARREKPDLILLDVMIPEMNGYQVCRELKGDERTQKIPVIFLTARGQESDRFWGMETGGNDYITKPFENTVLLEKIKSFF